MTMPMRVPPALLALAATITAAGLSILAGWQRGGLLAERALLVCLGVLLVVAAHLLPALCRPHGWRIRAFGIALWIGCMTATCYGHAVFFVMAQKHAGDVRAAVVPVVSVPGRNLAEIASDRAGVEARLARVIERKCGDRCATVRIERTTLTARLDALDAESFETRRRQLVLDRADAERIAAKIDPLVGLWTVFGVAPGRSDLVIGLAFAAVLEGVACFCWLLALWPVEVSATKVVSAQVAGHVLPPIPVTAVTPVASPSGVSVPTGDNAAMDDMPNTSASQYAHDISRVAAAIRNGTLRATVAEIRKYLGCSQAKAAALRKQIRQYSESGNATTDVISQS